MPENTERENSVINHLAINYKEIDASDKLAFLSELAGALDNARLPFSLEPDASAMLRLLSNLVSDLRDNHDYYLSTHLHLKAHSPAGLIDLSTELHEHFISLFNSTAFGLLNQHIPDAGARLQELSELGLAVKILKGADYKSVLNIRTAIAWASSPHSESIKIHLKTYLNDLNFGQEVNYLPDLFIHTDICAENNFWKTSLSIRNDNENHKHAFAIAAAIDHLKNGTDVPLEKVFELFSQNAFPHHHRRMSKFHAHGGMADTERTRRFFESYCEYMVTIVAKRNPSALKTLGKNLDDMCPDRSMTYNAFSKRFFLEQDMGYSL